MPEPIAGDGSGLYNGQPRGYLLTGDPAHTDSTSRVTGAVNTEANAVEIMSG